MDPIDKLVALALEEDLGSAGDVTSQALIPPQMLGKADFLVKEPLVLAGIDAVVRTFRAVDPKVEVAFTSVEGTSIKAKQIVGTVRGSMRSILVAERTALNFLQRLSGIASASAQAVAALKGTRCQILDTRKTTPGWRALEKAAVRAGGATNHRFGLFDGVLIKDNHIAAVGSISEAVRRARASAHHLMKVEVEVVSLKGVEEALAAGADVLLLDNMDIHAMRRAVEVIGGRAKTEASGGISLDRLPQIAAIGIDYISMGALTHSARGMDISLEVAQEI